MDIFESIFGKKKGGKSANPTIKYKYIGKIEGDIGLCSDNNCPCPQVPILKGEGYFFIEEIVEGYFKGNLTCEQGAKLRNLDLAIARSDAKHWWETGEIPERVTPKAK